MKHVITCVIVIESLFTNMALSVNILHFSRLSAIYNGTFMLDRPDPTIVFDANGKVVGVRHGEYVAKANTVICDPSYTSKGVFGEEEKPLDKCTKVGQVHVDPP